MKKLIPLLFAFGCTLAVTPALAQQYPLSGGPNGTSVGSVVHDYLNPSGQAVPDSAANPHPVTCVSGCSGSSGIDPCQTVIKTTLPISQAGSATLINGTATKKTYICSYVIIISDAESFSITEGTGTNCGTGAAALLGSTTVANGMSIAANGGLAQSNGSATVISALNAAADNVCVLQSGSGRLAGTMSYVQQ